MDFLKDLSIDKIRNVAEDVYNQTKSKSDVEARVYEVLSHKNWGASSTLLNDIARDTVDSEKFYIVTKLIWENLENPRPSAWRVVFKGLTLLEHLLKNGSERCVDDARNHSHALRALFNFNYYEGTVDRGIGVRELSKKIVDLLSDDDTIRDERAKARQLREKFGTRMDGVGSASSSGGSSSYAGYGYDSDMNSNNHMSFSAAATSNKQAHFGGRYSDTSNFQHDSPAPVVSTPSSASSSIHPKTATAAASSKNFDSDLLDSNLPKKNKKKSKKKPEDQDLDTNQNTSTIHAIDLLSFDAPTNMGSGYFNNQTSVGLDNDDDFDAFQSASPAAVSSSSSKDVSQSSNNDPFDAFGDFTSAPTSSTLSSKPILSSQQVHQPAFDAFTTPVVSSTGYHRQDSFSQMNISHSMSKPMGVTQPITTGMSKMMIQTQPYQTSSTTVVKQQAMNPLRDDEFGDFEDAAAAASKRTVSSSSTVVDPINKLISLDSLTSYKKKEDKLKDPIIFNDLAAQYVKEKHSTTSSITVSTTQAKGSPFLGVDGLQKPINIMPHDSTSANHRLSGMPVMSSTSASTSMMAQPNINPMMTSHPMYSSSPLAPNPMSMMGSSNTMMSMNSMNTQSMMGGNSMMMMGAGGTNMMQHPQTQQPYSMNQTMMNPSNVGNANPMGYNIQSSNSNSTNRLGGAPMSGW